MRAAAAASAGETAGAPGKLRTGMHYAASLHRGGLRHLQSVRSLVLGAAPKEDLYSSQHHSVRSTSRRPRMRSPLPSRPRRETQPAGRATTASVGDYSPGKQRASGRRRGCALQLLVRSGGKSPSTKHSERPRIRERQGSRRPPGGVRGVNAGPVATRSSPKRSAVPAHSAECRI